MGAKAIVITIWWVLGCTLCAGLVGLIRYTSYGSFFAQQREQSAEKLLHSAGENFARTVMEHVSPGLASLPDSAAHAQQIETNLRRLIQQLDEIASTDRATSLDYVFDIYSVLLAFATLLFGGIGIYAGIQYHGLMKDMKELRQEVDQLLQDTDEKMHSAETSIDKKLQAAEIRIENCVAATHQKLDDAVTQTRASLHEIATQGHDMIGAVALTLEKFIRTLNLDEKNFREIMLALDRADYRWQLFSPEAKARKSALNFFCVNGVCEDLSMLNKIWKNDQEPAQIRNLAQEAILMILDRCPHGRRHPELNFSTGGKPQ